MTDFGVQYIRGRGGKTGGVRGYLGTFGGVWEVVWKVTGWLSVGERLRD